MVVVLFTPAVFESICLIKLNIMCSQISREERRERERWREGTEKEKESKRGRKKGGQAERKKRRGRELFL